jgi:hypothetical protein
MKFVRLVGDSSSTSRASGRIEVEDRGTFYILKLAAKVREVYRGCIDLLRGFELVEGEFRGLRRELDITRNSVASATVRPFELFEHGDPVISLSYY